MFLFALLNFTNVCQRYLQVTRIFVAVTAACLTVTIAKVFPEVRWRCRCACARRTGPDAGILRVCACVIQPCTASAWLGRRRPARPARRRGRVHDHHHLGRLLRVRGRAQHAQELCQDPARHLGAGQGRVTALRSAGASCTHANSSALGDHACSSLPHVSFRTGLHCPSCRAKSGSGCVRWSGACPRRRCPSPDPRTSASALATESQVITHPLPA